MTSFAFFTCSQVMDIHQFATNPYRNNHTFPSKSSSDDDDGEFLPSTDPCHGFVPGEEWHAIPLKPEAREYYERIVRNCGLHTSPSSHIDHHS
ncbi:MAG: hypothetical protein LBF94_03940 [Puniceicoccales bacterium]|nr:hypothetical protein [Puniceicoccales bacterium]